MITRKLDIIKRSYTPLGGRGERLTKDNVSFENVLEQSICLPVCIIMNQDEHEHLLGLGREALVTEAGADFPAATGKSSLYTPVGLSSGS
jgi:hypothetical protein